MSSQVNLDAELAHLDHVLAEAVDRKRRAGSEAERRAIDLELRRETERRTALHSDDELTKLVAAVARNVAAGIVVEDTIEGWVDDVLKRARDGARRRLDGEVERLTLRGISELGEAKASVARLGASAWRDVLASSYADDQEAIELTWLATSASFDERRKALRDMTIVSVGETDQREADLQAWKTVLIRAGTEGVKYAVPFLLAAMG